MGHLEWSKVDWSFVALVLVVFFGWFIGSAKLVEQPWWNVKSALCVMIGGIVIVYFFLGPLFAGYYFFFALMPLLGALEGKK